MNKKIWIVVGIVAVVGILILIIINTSSTPSTNTPAANNTSGSTDTFTTSPSTNPAKDITVQTNLKPSTKESRVVFSVTDAAADMSNISEVSLTVSNVEMHDAFGWTTVFPGARTYSLLALKANGESKILADIKAKISAYPYDKIRMNIDAVSIKTKSGATVAAKVPLTQIESNLELYVKENMTSYVSLDFLADKSMLVTMDGQYIFAPVMNIQTVSGATMSVTADGAVSRVGGHLDRETKIWVNIDGSVNYGLQLIPQKKLIIDVTGAIKAGF